MNTKKEKTVYNRDLGRTIDHKTLMAMASEELAEEVKWNIAKSFRTLNPKDQVEVITYIVKALLDREKTRIANALIEHASTDAIVETYNTRMQCTQK